MKKRIFSILLCVVMLMIGIVGCAGGQESAQQNELTLQNIKVGFVHISDPSDKGYTYNHDQGTKAMQAELGLEDEQIINKYNVSQGAECDTALRELVDAGCNIIFATSFGFEDYVIEVAKEYPEIEFCHATGYQAASSGLSNFHNYFASIYEARYAAGIAAGLKTKSDKLGYVAAFPYAEVISGFSAFYLGAKSVNPDVVMEIKYTNTWNDPKLESEVAQSLVDIGCDVISQHSDSTASATTAEKNGVWQVGYNADMIEAAPKASLISARIDWSVYLTEAVSAVIEGKPIPSDWCKGFDSEGEKDVVYLSPLNEEIAAEGTEEKIAEAIEGIRAGNIHVFAGPLKGSGTDMQGNSISIELKEGEHFPEQEVASAPSWNYILEGCTVTD